MQLRLIIYLKEACITVETREGGGCWVKPNREASPIFTTFDTFRTLENLTYRFDRDFNIEWWIGKSCLERERKLNNILTIIIIQNKERIFPVVLGIADEWFDLAEKSMTKC